MSAKQNKTSNDRKHAAISLALDNLERAKNSESTVVEYVTNYLVLILWMTGKNAEQIFAYITNKIGKCPISLAGIQALVKSFEKKLPKQDPEMPMD